MYLCKSSIINKDFLRVIALYILKFIDFVRHVLCLFVGFRSDIHHLVYHLKITDNKKSHSN